MTFLSTPPSPPLPSPPLRNRDVQASYPPGTERGAGPRVTPALRSAHDREEGRRGRATLATMAAVEASPTTAATRASERRRGEHRRGLATGGAKGTNAVSRSVVWAAVTVMALLAVRICTTEGEIERPPALRRRWKRSSVCLADQGRRGHEGAAVAAARTG